MSKILQGNCLELIKALDDSSIDLVVTDPPYKVVSGGMTTLTGGIFNRNNHPNTANGKMFDHNDIAFKDWLPEVYRVVKSGSHTYVMCSGRTLNDLTNASLDAGFEFQNLLVWDKGSVTPNRYYMQRTEFILLLRKGAARTINDPGSQNIIKVSNEVGSKLHPTQKPIGLMKLFISNSSNKGDTVLDPFAGSGSTIIAAEQLRREGIGFELDEKYTSLARGRLKIETKQESLL